MTLDDHADAGGRSTEVVLAAYRVGDSPINAITPLNAYFVVVWTIFLAAWHLLGLPWGF